MRNLLMSAVLVGASLLGSTVFAQELVEGRNYVTLSSPVPTAQPEKSKSLRCFGTAALIATSSKPPSIHGLQTYPKM